tara:strand:+ start:1220 stop:1495 length:276 start_codon:yes stop_codon:yes gene_type:complete
MISIYFTQSGTWQCDAENADFSDDCIGSLYFLAEAPDVPRWRLRLDIDTGVVTDAYEGLSTAEAEAQQTIDLQAKHDADVAAREAAQSNGA